MAAVAGIITLYTSAIVATKTWVVRRNFRLLVLASKHYLGSERYLARKRYLTGQEVEPAASSLQVAHFVPRDENNQAIRTLHGYKSMPLWVTSLAGGAIFILVAAPGLLDYLGGPRLTVFGPLAARIAVFALTATTFCAALLLLSAYGAGRRVIALCGYVRGRILDARQPEIPPTSEEIPGFWKGGAEMPNAFPATPVLAFDCGADAISCDVWTGKSGDRGCDGEAAGDAWAAELAKILYSGVVSSRSRFALFALLVSELSLFRWIAAGAVLCAFAGMGIVFLYPIEADTLLILNLFILAVAGLVCGYMAVVFERDGVLSNVVCNRTQKAEISIGLFSFISSPFIALAAAIALVEIPGVVDWAGGLFVMMRSLGIHP